MTPDMDRTEASTIRIAGRRYPACIAICPREEGLPERSDLDRSLGGPMCGGWTYIPAENGILVQVEPCDRHGDCWYVHLYSPTCAKSFDPNDDDTWMWLPQRLALVAGELMAEVNPRVGEWYWTHAESWWVVEHIDRVSRLPFQRGNGPQVRLVPLDYFPPIDEEAR